MASNHHGSTDLRLLRSSVGGASAVAVGFLDAAIVALAIAGICATPAFAQAPNVVIQWNNAALQGVRDSKLGPPMVARALFIIHNCVYDTWAAYDRTAVGTVFGRSLRRPKSERTLANKNQPSASLPIVRWWTYFRATKARCSIL